MEEILKIWLACQGDMSGTEYISLLNNFGTVGKAVEEIEKYLSKGMGYKDCPPILLKMRPKLLNAFDVKITDKLLLDFEKSYKSQGVRGIVITEKDFPEELREISNPPAALFVKGNPRLIANPNFLRIAMVGARNCSEYGARAAMAIGGGLAERGAIIVSGMALGIDTAAHRGALEVCGKTVAVLGSGILNIYPSSNRGIYEKISEEGAVVSEFPPDLKALAYNFPRRNRIISGLSKGVLVVEAGMKSGSLITVDYALDQGRDVFAIPGNINSVFSKGTNFLIKQGAKIVLRPSDVLEEYGLFEEDKPLGRDLE